MRALGLIALVGCNQAYGLTATERYDARIDAPFACPPIGTAPRFSEILHQPTIGECFDYHAHVARGVAVASCYTNTANDFTRIHEGPIDAPLGLSPGLMPAGQYDTIDQPRLTPDGNDMFVHTKPFATSVHTISRYHRVADAWQWAENLPFGDVTLSTVGPGPRMMIVISGELHEIVFAGATWQDVAQYTTSELGGYVYNPSLTSDGLRLVYSAAVGLTTQVMYADRATTAQRFSPPQPVAGAPNIPDPGMTDDCSRIYFAALEAVFYVQQE